MEGVSVVSEWNMLFLSKLLNQELLHAGQDSGAAVYPIS